MYDLSQHYVVGIRQNEQTFTHKLKHPAQEDIEAFERNTQRSIVVRAEATESQNQATAAYIALYDALIQETEGYGDMEVPPLHKRKVAQAFGEMRVLDAREAAEKYGAENVLTAGGLNHVVHMEVLYGGRFVLVSHVLRTPNDRELTEFEAMDAYSKTKVRKNKVELMSTVKIPHLVRLYDGMVLAVQGYAKDGGPLSVEERKLIPALHKKKAVESVFADVSALEEEFEKN